MILEVEEVCPSFQMLFQRRQLDNYSILAVEDQIYATLGSR